MAIQDLRERHSQAVKIGLFKMPHLHRKNFRIVKDREEKMRGRNAGSEVK